MKKIKVNTISKKESGEFDRICLDFAKMGSKFAKIEINNVFSKRISQAQNRGADFAKASYTAAFEPLMDGFCVALDPKGKELDTQGFCDLLEQRDTISFFIGGAYGFNGDFLDRCDFVLSLSKLTMGHRVAKVVLLEQIFRGLSLLNNHPYHK